jgi:preprotein translocase subunit SecE
MAKGKKKPKKRNRELNPDQRSPARPYDDEMSKNGLDDDDAAVATVDSEETSEDEEQSMAVRVPARRRSGASRSDRSARVGGLSVYKPGQGYYTRIGTAIGSGILMAGLWNYLYSLMEAWIDPDKPWTLYMQLGIPTVVILLLGILVYWVAGKNPRTCDFMILTEGEMKKVSWSTRKEVIGSTKVVIFTVIAMALMLFFVDVAFAWFFHLIGVLKSGPFG